MHQAGHEETNFRDLLGAINLYFLWIRLLSSKNQKFQTGQVPITKSQNRLPKLSYHLRKAYWQWPACVRFDVPFP